MGCGPQHHQVFGFQSGFGSFGFLVSIRLLSRITQSYTIPSWTSNTIFTTLFHINSYTHKLVKLGTDLVDTSSVVWLINNSGFDRNNWIHFIIFIILQPSSNFKTLNPSFSNFMHFNSIIQVNRLKRHVITNRNSNSNFKRKKHESNRI